MGKFYFFKKKRWFFGRFFCYLRPAFGHGRLGHPQSLEYFTQFSQLRGWEMVFIGRKGGSGPSQTTPSYKNSQPKVEEVMVSQVFPSFSRFWVLKSPLNGFMFNFPNHTPKLGTQWITSIPNLMRCEIRDPLQPGIINRINICKKSYSFDQKLCQSLAVLLFHW